MVSGRKLYRSVAEEAVANSRQLLRDARKLKSAGSRGHSCSSAILAIEESSKAIVYHAASEGIYRIVKNKPNYVTTFRKKDLMDHRFKHLLVAGTLADWIFYMPFYNALEGTRKSKLDRAEVEMLINRAVHTHRRLRLELNSGGRAAKELEKTFTLLEKLNDKKNAGLYVDHTSNRVLVPSDTPKKDLEDVIDLADVIVEMVSEIVKATIAPEMKELLVSEAREAATHLRSLKKEKGD